ncbi:MAG: amino acid adenylation domain-containing protein [Tatlockia sp.]|nr:amino acid adenylation domain-containing protein [Tatlockia sp.]
MSGLGSVIVQIRQLFENSADNYPNNLALICDNVELSYQELESRSNQFANYLISQGVNENHSIGILSERSLDCYLSILAILKTGASYVPIEAEYPDERINYIFSDMPFHSVITSDRQFARQTNINFPKVQLLSQIKAEIAKQSTSRPPLSRTSDDQLCYVIYTSGSTGKPKGVEITHRNICHYIAVASELYLMSPLDKVYQGFSLAFDASMEEQWMAFANGATLIACTSKDIRSGVGLVEFLDKHKVSVFSTVPTLLSTLHDDLPSLRVLILGGEACTENLVNRWSRPGRRIFNTYGPTEATIIATYSECHAEKPVTIGKALPGYEILIVDEQFQPLPQGQQGELCIAGPGIARGYVNRPDLTAIKFIAHPNDNKQRLYRTGDLATILENGDIQFLGRIDDQVKLRGFRIELNEIESIMMEHDSISQAVVALQELEQPTLVAYLSTNSKFDLPSFKSFLKRRLPHYMLPSHYEIVTHFPLLASGKINRKELPKPAKVVREPVSDGPTTELEQIIINIWETHLQQKHISINDDFFYDLGGHSLSAAAVVSNLRTLPAMQHISMVDLYQNSTAKKLAEKFSINEAPFNQENLRKKNRSKPTIGYYFCSIGQFFGCLLQYAINAWQLLAIIIFYNWITADTTSYSIKAVEIFLALFIAMPVVSMAFVISAKWILVGRVKPGIYKLWGGFYFRWWLAKRLQENVFSPSYLLGSPLLPLYYRLLGAKIGKNAYIGSASLANLDMLTMGDNSSIGFDARLTAYVVEDGWLKIGFIKIGNNCFVGARSVIGLNCTIKDGACLDDMSLLQNGRSIPENQFYSGSPASPIMKSPEHISAQYKGNDNPSLLKKVTFGFLHYFSLIFTMSVYYICYLPALILISYFHSNSNYLLTILFAIPLGTIIFLCSYYLSIGILKKILMNKVKPGIYPLLSLHYLRQWTIVKMLDTDEVSVLADTLYFPYILRFLGAKIGKRVEMGETPHIIPDLVTVQDEGFTASAVALAWPTIFQGSIKYAPVQIGKRGFVGNDSLLPHGANIGNNGLLGCMSTTPPGNQAANDHSAWLGSPAIFLPKREISSDYTDNETFTPPKRLIRIRFAIEFIKIILPTMFALTGLFNMLYVLNVLFGHYSFPSIVALLPLAEVVIAFTMVTAIVGLKWLLLGRLKPMTKPIWSAFIWKNDIVKYLYSYFVDSYFVQFVIGTPFISMLYRAYGAKIGKRVFIDSSDFGEFDLVTIGDDVCINYEAVIQTHLYEDRIFKMSTIHIASECNIGVASIVLYSTIMGKNSTLGGFSLLMKGEHLPENTNWQGIPAQHMKYNLESDVIA